MLFGTILIILILSLLIIFYLPVQRLLFVKQFALGISGLILIISCLIYAFYSNDIFTSTQYFLSFNFGSLNLNYFFIFGFDAISLFFFLLSSFLVFLCLLFIWKDNLFKELSILLLTIQLMLIITFTIMDLFLFYLFFEAILIPMFLIIGIWGSRNRKIRAVYLFFFYTLCGSILFLVSILYIVSVVGSLNIEILSSWKFSFEEQQYLWLAFFLSFASKIPMFPFHIWLPEAHVEAPTIGSVLLAGILLKLGVYGFLKFSITLFLEASFFYSPLIFLLGVLGIIHASLSAVRQTDLKRIIAYSSVAHMNLIVIGIFSFNLIGLEGAVLQSISHGFISGGLFLLVGMLYDRYHTRDLFYYNGLVHIMPLYIILFFIFTLGNIAVPGTSSFVGEFLLLLGTFKTNAVVCLFSALSIVLCGSYSLWLCNRIAFGNILLSFSINRNIDLSKRELLIMLPLLFLIFLVGLYPNIFLLFIESSISKLSIVVY